MADRTPPEQSRRMKRPEADSDSDRDSGVGDDAGDDADRITEVDMHDDTEEDGHGEDFTVFVAFQGSMDDEDFTQKLDVILSGIPNMLDMG